MSFIRYNVENDLKMKKIVFVSLVFIFLIGCKCKKNTLETADGKIRDCPEMMIENRMPQIIDENSEMTAVPRKYYIYKGERREIAEFDTAWVNRNCDVEVQVVY